jgi:hypothetical protein
MTGTGAGSLRELPGRERYQGRPLRVPPDLDRRLLLALCGVKLLIHIVLSGRYGYFRDELYQRSSGRA